VIMGKPLILISIGVTKERERELGRNLRNLQTKGYPKVGDKIIAIKSGNTWHNELHLTKGKTYEVIDNIDLIDGYLHVASDDYGCVVLSPQILQKFFGIHLKR